MGLDVGHTYTKGCGITRKCTPRQSRIAFLVKYYIANYAICVESIAPIRKIVV